MKLFASTLLLTAIGVSSVVAAPEESKWIWGENRAKTGTDGVKSARYQVHEYPNSESQYTGGPLTLAPVQFRPQYSGPYGSESGPIVPAVNHAHQSTPLVLVGPNGPTGIVGRPDRKPLGPALNGDVGSIDFASSAGSMLSLIKEDGRYREYDVCKCSYGFNCPGLKFGSCAKSKQYCCYDSRKVNGVVAPGYADRNVHPDPLPFRPFNAIPSDYYAQHRPQGSHYYGSYQANGHDRYSPYNDVTGFARSTGKSHEDEQKRGSADNIKE